MYLYILPPHIFMLLRIWRGYAPFIETAWVFYLLQSFVSVCNARKHFSWNSFQAKLNYSEINWLIINSNGFSTHFNSSFGIFCDSCLYYLNFIFTFKLPVFFPHSHTEKLVNCLLFSSFHFPFLYDSSSLCSTIRPTKHCKWWILIIVQNKMVQIQWKWAIYLE